jgi:hypothetical protein
MAAITQKTCADFKILQVVGKSTILSKTKNRTKPNKKAKELNRLIKLIGPFGIVTFETV